MKIFRNLGLMIVAIGWSAAYLPAQTAQGRILGEVSDVSGAMVSGAKITITNTATGVSRVVTTNDVGSYLAAALDPGTYRVSAEVTGFKKAESSSVQLEVSKDVRVNLRLQPGSANETIEVTGEAPLTETVDTTLNGVLSNKAINELPLQGRDFQNLLPLHPGVQRTPGGGFHSVTSNGNRPDDNNFFIDGANDNDVYYGETVVNDAGISGTPASILPLDSIQEFNTQESPSADYGVKPGVVVNMGLKSGTNDIHGSAYYFHRNAGLDARNYFNPAPAPTSSILLHQFGASIGGPIKKGKWFYFFNYEGIRDKVGNPGESDSPVTVSLADQLGGIANSDGSPNSASFSIPDAIAYFSDPINVAYCQDQVGGPCAVSPLSQHLVDEALFLPNPGFTLKSSNPVAINFDFNNLNRGDNFVFKTDYVLNQANSVSARMIYSNTTQTEEDGFPLRPEWLSHTSPTTQVFGASWIWTPNTRWINEARFSYNRFNETIAPADSNVNPTTYGLNTGITDPRLFGFPTITPSVEFDSMGGVSGWPLATTPSATYNYSDTVSYNRGRHSLRFGGQFSDGKVNYFRAGYGRGRVDFRDLTDFIAGNVRRWRLLYGDPARDISMKSFGFFAQDTYRITPRVTLNFGLRYDVTGAIEDSQNRLANFDFTNGFQQVGQDIGSPYPTNYNNISPRLGIAWDVFGTGKTVLRAGGGIIYEQPSVRTFMFGGGGLNLNPSGLPQDDGTGNGTTVAGTGTITSFLQIHTGPEGIDWSQDGGTIFPVGTNSGSCTIDAQCDVFAVDPHLRTPYISNWNLNVQQQIGKDSVLQIGYVANHGTKLYSITDPNQVNYSLDDGSEALGRPLTQNCAFYGTGTGLCMPGIGFTEYLSNYSSSSYNSLQVTYTKRYSHGLYLLAGYTWAHAIDTATSNLAYVPQDSLNYGAERGNGDYDIRHRFTLSLTYDLPSKKTKSQMLEGWQVTTLAMLESAMPYSLYDSNDISGTGEIADRWNLAGNPKDLKWSVNNPPHYVDFYDGETDPACVAQAITQGEIDNLNYWGCYHQGSAVLTPPADGTFGTMGRNIFRGPGFYNWDFSFSKIFKIRDRLNFQLRAEFFNLINHPNFPTPTANTDLASPGDLATVSYTPDVRASNPVIGSGGSRHIQLGAKFTW